MLRLIAWATAGLMLFGTFAMMPGVGAEGRAGAAQSIDLAERLAAGQLRANRGIAAVEGTRGVRLTGSGGKSIAWIEGTDFAQGTIELDIRGKDVLQQSFVGVAFHRRDDNTYEVVYLRPFNFRATDPVRRAHAVQYIALPDYDWPKLREAFPEEFENPVDQAIDPRGWVRLRVVVNARNIQIYAGQVTSPTLEVRKFGAHDRGMIGLWVDVSDGDFSNLRVNSQ